MLAKKQTLSCELLFRVTNEIEHTTNSSEVLSMKATGRCYCGSLRYEITEEPVFNGQCHCRECQYISGGSPNVVMGVPSQGFSYTAGEPAMFIRDELAKPVTREF